jgi:hypothetical protein
MMNDGHIEGSRWYPGDFEGDLSWDPGGNQAGVPGRTSSSQRGLARPTGTRRQTAINQSEKELPSFASV